MTIQNKVRLGLLGILALFAVVGLIDYPKGPDLNIGTIQKEIKVHLGLDLEGGASLLYKADVSAIEDAQRQEAVDGVRDVIENRINAFGVTEPNIQTIHTGDEWRVLVELPGITDINEAIDRIGATPALDFKTEAPPPTYTEEELAGIRTRNEEAKKNAEDVLQKAQAEGADFAALAKEFSADTSNADKGGDLGEVEPGDMVEPFNDVVFNKAEVGKVYPEIVETQFGYHVILVYERTTPTPEEGTNTNASNEVDPKAKVRHILIRKESETPQVFGPTYTSTGLTGEQLERADVAFDPTTSAPTVALQFNEAGKELFSNITRENVGKTVAIYLDDAIISAPVVQQEITTGEAVITGSFTVEEAKELSQRLNAGALPVPIELVSQQNVGPTLGQDSVQRSVFSGVIGLFLLGIFMVIYYRLPGVVAMISIVMYSMIVLALFKLWPVTLTLAGIAGFILSIGMALDANVLIAERMKEELRSGKPLRQSITDGFSRAWLSIRDSNASSLITCLILYWFGSSLIRGFAITLALGIVVSMFSAITISRTLLLASPVKNLWWYGVKRKAAPRQTSKNPTNTK